MPATDYDVLVIGSGFGGSVTALRLTEKGYRVTVVEAGRRFEDADLPKTSWRLHKYVWAPKLKLFGIQRVHMMRDVMILAGAGVGGGSLNYANLVTQAMRELATGQLTVGTNMIDEQRFHQDYVRQRQAQLQAQLNAERERERD